MKKEWPQNFVFPKQHIKTLYIVTEERPNAVIQADVLYAVAQLLLNPCIHVLVTFLS